MHYGDVIDSFFYNFNSLTQGMQVVLFVKNNYRFRPDLVMADNNLSNTMSVYNDILNTFLFMPFNDVDFGLQ